MLMNRLSRRRLLRRGADALLASTAGAVALSCVPGQPATPATPQEPVQLRLLVPRLEGTLVDPLPDWMDAAVKEVNDSEPAGYRLTMQVLDTPAAEWAETINTLRSAGAPAQDLLVVHLGDVPAMHSRQALLSLESYRKRERSLNLNDYFLLTLAAHSWHDRLYALPFIASPQIMRYPPDLFDAANLSPPPADWSWDDFLVTATALTRDLDGDGRTDQWGYSLLPGSTLSAESANGQGGNTKSLTVRVKPATQLSVVPYIWQNGGAAVTPDGSVQLDQPAALEAVAFVADLVRQASPGLTDLSGGVNLNRVGLSQFHPAAGNFWRSPPHDFDLAEPPRQQQQATTLTTSGLAIGAEAAHPDVAWDALRTLAASLERRGLLPPRKSLAGSVRQIEPRLTDGDIAVMLSALDYARAPAWEHYHEVLGILFRELDIPILLGAKSVDAAVRDASAALRRLHQT